MNTEDTVQHIFMALEAAEIPIAQFSEATNISRETLHRWKRGNGVNDMLRLRIAEVAAKKIREALRENRLPFKPETPARKRQELLKKIIGGREWLG